LNQESQISPTPSTETRTGPAASPGAIPGIGWRPTRILWCAAVLSLAISCGSVYLYDRFMAQKIVAVDLKGFLAEQKQAYLRGEIDSAALQRCMDDLERVVADIPPRYAVLMGDAVIRNVEVVKP